MANSASLPALSSSPNDLRKKKRANRSAKLKQCKLDARRDQWLSQVKNKGSNGESSPPIPSTRPIGPRKLDPARDNAAAAESLLGLQDSETEFAAGRRIARKDDRPCSSSISSGCFSGSATEDDEEEDGDSTALDDWEAVADALIADHHHLEEPKPSITAPVPTPAPPSVTPKPPEPRAWRPDDAFRPSSLPNLSKQRSFDVSRGFRNGGRTVVSVSVPSSCPICYEDLDVTDTSFLPCSCGFRLCLFCHKRILEADGRCPGCRKPYGMILDGSPPVFLLSRSCSMNIR
ncbi:hypothetical protein QJS04_geneDACA023532 [Acorus gramineus]|uniref:RING-type domain-containing protein n=1 Tax=Acorus gramineus TaxID=55184 RepID=A0AAV9BAL5_ACOGR|nr:hypothetical protein QJS04_geneDACA023532 [Acorus gramineus]